MLLSKDCYSFDWAQVLMHPYTLQMFCPLNLFCTDGMTNRHKLDTDPLCYWKVHLGFIVESQRLKIAIEHFAQGCMTDTTQILLFP